MRFVFITNPNDPHIPKILATVEEDRAKGHYKTVPGMEGPVSLGFQQTLDSIVRSGRRTDAPLGACLHVVFRKFSGVERAVGFIITSETPLGFPDGNIPFDEAWMGGLFPEYRGRGLGKVMMEEYLRVIKVRALLVARCFKASHKMAGILQSIGFQRIDDSDHETIFLVYGEPAAVQRLREIFTGSPDL